MNDNRGTIHTDKFLTKFSLLYLNGNMIADIVCPRIDVVKESDLYAVYGRQHFRPESDLRADKTPANFTDSYKIDSTPTYTCLEHSLADLVSDRERKNADAPIKPDMDATNGLTMRLGLNREKRAADLYTTAASWAAANVETLSGTEQWNDDSFDSTSKDDAIEVRIDNGKEAVRQAVGQDPTHIIIPSAVEKVVKRDSAIRDLQIYTKNGMLEDGSLPDKLFGMKLLVPGSIYASEEEGQTFVGADVWGKNVVLLYIPPNIQTPRTMVAGLTFQSQKRQTNKWRENGLKSDAIEVCEIVVEKIVSTVAGALIADCIA